MSIDISNTDSAGRGNRAQAGFSISPALRMLILVVALAPLALIGITLALAHRTGNESRATALPKGPPTLDSAEITRKAAGFQHRGASLVGELCSREGIPVRVVLDAQSRKLIGLHVLDRDLPGCLPAKAPGLQGSATPAN